MEKKRTNSGPFRKSTRKHSIYSRLSAKLLDDNVSAKEVTESVQEEPALAAAILKTVNSAYYGLTEKMSSLHHAILYLGFNNVYQLILENSIKNIMPQAIPLPITKS